MPHRTPYTGGLEQNSSTRDTTDVYVWPDFAAVRLQRMLMSAAHCTTDEECMNWIMQYAAPLRERFLQGDSAAILLEQFSREPEQVAQQIQQALYH